MAHKCSGSFLPWGVVVESKIVFKNVIAKTQKYYFTYSFEFLPIAWQTAITKRKKRQS